MEAREAYGIFMGMRLHFEQKSYDYSKYGPKKCTEEELNKAWVLSNRLAKDYQKEELEQRCIALFKDRSTWIDVIPSTDGQTAYNRHLANSRNWEYNLSIHLELIAAQSHDVLSATKTKSQFQVPLISRMLMAGDISMETFVCLDNLLHFSKRISPILWKDRGNRIEKYKAFFRPDLKKVARIAKPFFER